MITRIEINGFKSFVDFQMEFTPLTVIAGTNGSGKSNLFDALHLLANLSKTDLRSAFSSKLLRGEVSESFTKYGDKLRTIPSFNHFEQEVVRVFKEIGLMR